MNKLEKFRLTTLALERLAPNAEYTVFEDCSIQWDSKDINQPTEEAIDKTRKKIQAEIPLNALRFERNRLIAETDWWVLPDRTPTQEQLNYRQELRDITNKYSSIDEVVWPKKPNN